MLHISISILSNKSLVKDPQNIEYSENLNMLFILTFQEIYGKENATFNVHSLLHLAKDVTMYGCLEQFSAFPYENYICSIKKLLRKGDKPLQQLSRRLAEYDIAKNFNRTSRTEFKFKAKKEHYSCSVSHLFVEAQIWYKYLIADSWQIVVDDERNNTIMMHNSSILRVLSIALANEKLCIVGRKYEIIKDLYNLSDFRSGLLGIYFVRESDDIVCEPCISIKCKMFKISCDSNYVVFPIIHTISES